MLSMHICSHDECFIMVYIEKYSFRARAEGYGLNTKAPRCFETSKRGAGAHTVFSEVAC